ncbi:MAG TPA: hypothetical protein VFH03_05900 [Actinoplanes sp.]|nr:hypothetical protein [Actinoplanes sp.]
MREPARGTRRRWWLPALVTAWAVALAALGWWSVRTDPATVPEQYTIADALPVLDKAAGTLVAAAVGDDRAVTLGPLRVRRDCRVTPVRDGMEAVRVVTVVVPAGRALPVLAEIAARLPAGFRAEAGDSSGGRRVGMHADAGGFVAIDAGEDADTQEIRIEVTTGCRPLADGVDVGAADRPATAPPVLARALTAVGGSGQVRVREVDCPNGGTTRTYTVEGVSAPGDLGRSLQPVVDGHTVLRAEPSGWAYLVDGNSVVIERIGRALRLSATTPCA